MLVLIVAIDSALKGALTGHSRLLADLEHHPQPNDIFQSLLDPLLYPIISGWTRALPPGKITQVDCLKLAGAGETIWFGLQPGSYNVVQLLFKPAAW